MKLYVISTPDDLVRNFCDVHATRKRTKVPCRYHLGISRNIKRAALREINNNWLKSWKYPPLTESETKPLSFYPTCSLILLDWNKIVKLGFSISIIRAKVDFKFSAGASPILKMLSFENLHAETLYANFVRLLIFIL